MGSIAAEILTATLSAIGPRADNTQRFMTDARDTRKRLATKRARKDESPKDAAGSGSPPPK
eukprot:8932386-Pyramimonas_sp.AAC.1